MVINYSFNDRIKYDDLACRIAIRQELTDNISIYGTVNRGFKAGTYAIQDTDRAPVRPQYIMAYDGSIKSELFDRRLRLNISAYH